MHNETRLIRRVPHSEMDTVKARHKLVGKEKDLALLTKCETLWNNLKPIREEGARAYRFTYGDQWSDTIIINGKLMTQREYLRRQDIVPLQTNQIKNKVDTIVGTMIKEKNEPICMARAREEQRLAEVLTTALQANCNKNNMESLYQLALIDLNVVGMAAMHESWEYRNGRLDSWTDYCDTDSIFFDTELRDPRFWDMSLIGQFYDMSFEELTVRFARNEKDYAILKEIYPGQTQLKRVNDSLDIDTRKETERLVFLSPTDSTKCRVIEVWTKETRPRYRVHDTNEGTLELVNADDIEMLREIDAINEERKSLALSQGWDEEETPIIEKEFFIDDFWYCRFLAPDGTILWEGESPYADRQHPFSLVATPFAGGKIVGYMHDAIDHNIAINRAICLHDWLIRCQAKGVTVVPKDLVPDDMSFEDFAYSWTSIDDLVYIDTKPGVPMPQVFYGSAQTFNVSDLINTYTKLMENSTAISGAIQGKTPYSGTSGSLYAQMSANSSTPIAALLSKFRSFMEGVSTKKAKNIAAFYTDKRLEEIAGAIDNIFDDPNLHLTDVADIEFDLAIKESTETPVYRAIINDDLKEFLMNGIISFEEYLTYADQPYADKMLQGRQARQAEMQSAQQSMEGQQATPMESPAVAG